MSAKFLLSTSAIVLAMALGSAPVNAAPARATPAPTAGSPCARVEMGPIVKLSVGKASVLKLESPVTRILLGNPEDSQVAHPKEGAQSEQANRSPGSNRQNTRRPGVADVDVLLLSPREIYLLGKTVGSTNVIMLDRAGQCTMIDVAVGMDTASLSAMFKELLPTENGIKVSSAADSVVLSGMVSDAVAADRAVDIAGAYVRRVSGGSAGGRASTHDNIINMLSVAAPQQVMLEVKVAEISRTLLDKLGVEFAATWSRGDWAYSLLSNFGRTDTSGFLSALKTAGNPIAASLDAQRDNGLVKILAEPNVLAISGQEGSFLAGGTIFIPVQQNDDGGITLEEKEFGVALKFTPTVLSDGRINLKVSPEVSELNPQGVGITVPGVSGLSVLPSFTTRRASTTVQLFDGQTFAIGGLIKNNVTTNIKAFPGLGEIPILGTLFRSSDFQTDKTELVFVVTPRLVKPLPPNYGLPTDSYVPPNRAEFFLNGRMEGTPPTTTQPADQTTEPESTGGFEVK
ncbi:type II and III secretion system protein family protein [Propionivibrio limicola]|uniref:type II and III secretion system protein family protein n=1 Tax=Propionivibrio limicola TaxID=167645 RepID=UPI001FED174E|nr:type II and III secretion system protein family protein [Propionivibrio limicola]